MTDAELEKMAEQATRHPTDGSWTTNPQDAFIAGYKKAREWVSVKERTPKPGHDVLVLTKTKMGGVFYKVTDRGDYDSGWHLDTNYYEVTHWMELPDKPEGVE